MWGFIILACLLLQGIFRLDECKASEESSIKHTVDPECFMNVSEIIRYHGYPSEEHLVESEDGYISRIFRIPHGRHDDANKGPRPIVFLQHAFISDASHWISNLPNNSFGFILADAGYDVWLGNARGNTWSANHKTLEPSEPKFWEFSFHEMGYYDVPAIVDFVLNKTGQQHLYYAGHSQGTAMGFIALSTRPELAEKIKIFFVLGPATTLTYSSTPTLMMPTFLTWLLRTLFAPRRIFTIPAFLRWPSALLCTSQPKFCYSILASITGYNPHNFNMSRMDMYVAHSPAGTSVQNYVNWLQVKVANRFQAYDHGSPEKNMEKYKQPTPPAYKIEDITTPIAIWSGGQDSFVNVTDVAGLIPRIRNLIYHKLIPEWSHLDFIWGLDATEHVYEEIIAIMKKDLWKGS